MFINTGGFPDHHKLHSNGKLHLQHHHHGHRHLQHFGQHHPPCRVRRLAACERRLLPDPRHHGSLPPAALLLKPPAAPLFLALTLLLTSHRIIPPNSNLPRLPFTALHRDHETNMDGLHKLFLSSLLKFMIQNTCIIQDISFNKGGLTVTWRSSPRPPQPIAWNQKE